MNVNKMRKNLQRQIKRPDYIVLCYDCGPVSLWDRTLDKLYKFKEK